MDRNNLFRPHANSAFRQASAHRQLEATDEDRRHVDMFQTDSQLPDTCSIEEIVPSSQTFPPPLLPYGSMFQSLMHAALFEPPPPSSPATPPPTGLVPSPVRPPLPASLSLTTAPSTSITPLPVRPSPPTSSPVTPTTGVAPSPARHPPPSSSGVAAPVGLRPLPTRPPLPHSLPSTASSTIVAPSPTTHAASSGEPEASRKKKSNEIWSANDVNVLLDYYEDKWVSLNRGNFKAKHWADIARDVNSRCGTEFTETQCKYKWENLKRTFMKERQKESASGAEPSRWEYFARMSDLLSGTPKVSGLQGGFVGEEFVSPEVVSLAEDEEMAVAEDDAPAPPPPAAAATENEGDAARTGNVADTNMEDVQPGPSIGPSVRGQRNKKRKSSTSLDGLGPSMERSMGAFAQTYERVEIERMKVQLEIAKLMAPRRDSPSDED